MLAVAGGKLPVISAAFPSATPSGAWNGFSSDGFCLSPQGISSPQIDAIVTELP